jgi:hypothetical protein
VHFGKSGQQIRTQLGNVGVHEEVAGEIEGYDASVWETIELAQHKKIQENDY